MSQSKDIITRNYPHEAAQLLREWRYKGIEGYATRLTPEEVVQRLVELQEQIADETPCPTCMTDAPQVCSGCWDPVFTCEECGTVRSAYR